MCEPTEPRSVRRTERVRHIRCVLLGVLIILNMVMIFSFSAEDVSESGNRSEGVTQTIVSVVVDDYNQLSAEEQKVKVDEYHPFIRKLAHFSEFALLGFLCGSFLFSLGKGKYWLCWICPAALCLLTAILDETYQIFTGRGPAVTDVLIDFGGSLAGLCLIYVIMYVAKKIMTARKERRSCEPPATA